MLPLSIEGIPDEFVAQFDLGATATIFYENALKNYYKKYPDLAAKIDTTNTSRQFDLPRYMLRNVTVVIDSIPSPVSDFVVYKNFGEEIPVDSMGLPSTKLIGSIGADFCRNKFLIIDYPRERLCLTDTLPERLFRQFEWVNCKIERGRIKVPFTFGKETHDLMFDTGSSLFPVVTDSLHWQRYADLEAGPIDTLKVPAWGSWVTVYGVPLKVPLAIGQQLFKNQHVNSIPGDDNAAFFLREQVQGLTGNALFLHETIVLDFIQDRFGLWKHNQG
ncbi:MAG: hypothetical protein D6715_06960 [Calditrichaeota bacterium]|nr:MAG: hypothetical protein D6715_06960 [Calditrichota bacterium]